MRENKAHLFAPALFIIYMGLLISVIFSFRAITSISLPLLLFIGIAHNKVATGKFFNPRLKHPFLIYCCLLFLLECISLLYARDVRQGWRNISLKSSLIIIPAGILCCEYLNETTIRNILKWYGLALFLACVYALAFASARYFSTHDLSVFVYHSLVSIYSGHAIQFSILVFVALAYLFETLKKGKSVYGRSIDALLILFFSLFLFLLSSKVVLAFFLLYILIFFARSFKRVRKQFIVLSAIGFILIFAFILVIPNPVSNRFREIRQTDFRFLEQEKYRPADYFNGLQFRMLQWRFVPQILTENKAWLRGVSVGDAQSFLDQKYIASNMYVGTPARGDKGFIGYNTHNQFLEALLQTGIPGLILFLIVELALGKMILEKKKSELSFVTILLMIYSFTESVLESQYSVFIFLFFPLFLYAGKNEHQS